MVPTHETTKATRTYASFIGTLKWVVPLIAVVVLIVVLLIA
jgi:hypothetical protein